VCLRTFPESQNRNRIKCETSKLEKSLKKNFYDIFLREETPPRNRKPSVRGERGRDWAEVPKAILNIKYREERKKEWHKHVEWEERDEKRVE
jgi:hypothetical protein